MLSHSRHHINSFKFLNIKILREKFGMENPQLNLTQIISFDN